MINNIRFILLFCTLCQFSILRAEPVLLQVGTYRFDADDFEYVYRKNRMAGSQTLDECLALYIPYKLKIAAAKDAGLDTLPEMIDQWTRYRHQLATDTFLEESGSELLDGLLLLAITDSAVWSKAARDSAGLRTFYQQNARAFKWEKRMNATIYYCSNENIARRVSRIVNNKNEGKGVLPDGLLAFFCGADDVSPCIDTVLRTLPKGANTIADHIKWKKGCSKILKQNNKYVFLDVHKIMRPARKTFEEAYGATIAGYRDELENKWVEQLRTKYPVTVNEEVWANLKKKYAE